MSDGLTHVPADINRPAETLPWRDGCEQCAGLRESVVSNGGLGLFTLALSVCLHFENEHRIVVVQRGAVMTVPKVGDVIETADRLDVLPVGAVLRNDGPIGAAGCIQQRVEDGWIETGNGNMVSRPRLPATLIDLPASP